MGLWIAWLVVTASAGFVGASIYAVLSHHMEERIARRMLDIFLTMPLDDLEPEYRPARAVWPRRDEW